MALFMKDSFAYVFGRAVYGQRTDVKFILAVLVGYPYRYRSDMPMRSSGGNKGNDNFRKFILPEAFIKQVEEMR
jgi:hypothetical protein